MPTSKDQAGGKSGTGSTRGGTPEQHAEAGRQSHKNDPGKKTGSGTRSDSSEQQSGTGRQGRSDSNTDEMGGSGKNR